MFIDKEAIDMAEELKEKDLHEELAAVKEECMKKCSKMQDELIEERRKNNTLTCRLAEAEDYIKKMERAFEIEHGEAVKNQKLIQTGIYSKTVKLEDVLKRYNMNMSVKDIAEELEVSDMTVYRRLRKLKRLGVIK